MDKLIPIFTQRRTFEKTYVDTTPRGKTLISNDTPIITHSLITPPVFHTSSLTPAEREKVREFLMQQGMHPVDINNLLYTIR